MDRRARNHFGGLVHWILDFHGLRLVVQSTDYARTSAKHRKELRAIVDSIRIER